jgi:hypothetical protein
MLRRVSLAKTDVSEERIASIIRVKRIGKLRTTIAVLSTEARCEEVLCTTVFILISLMMEVILSSETSVLTRATWRNIQEDVILHNHRRESLKSSVPCFASVWTAVQLFSCSSVQVPLSTLVPQAALAFRRAG